MIGYLGEIFNEQNELIPFCFVCLQRFHHRTIQAIASGMANAARTQTENP